METYKIENDIPVFGIQVKTFPQGIGEAFDKLVQMLPSDGRPFYGISTWKNEGMVYIAAAHETFKGEATKYNCEKYIVEKGDYLLVTVTGWQQKIDQIKNIFVEMVKDERCDRTRPCVEIYKNEQEMQCLVRSL